MNKKGGMTSMKITDLLNEDLNTHNLQVTI